MDTGRQRGSLQEQMARLQQTLANRDKRRARNKRSADGEAGQYDDRPPRRRAAAAVPRATGGIALGPGAGSSGADFDAPRTWRCDVCQATFTSEPAYQQHLDGPVHAKASARQREAQQRLERLGQHADLADCAVGAATWAAGDALHARTAPAPCDNSSSASAHGAGMRPCQPTRGAGAGASSSNGVAQSSQQQRGKQAAGGQLQDRGPRRGGAAGVGALPSLNHRDLVAAAQRSVHPLTLDGWQPPTIALPPLASDRATGSSSAVPAAPAAALPARAAGGGGEASVDDAEDEDREAAGGAAAVRPGSPEVAEDDGGAADEGGGGGGGGFPLVAYGSASDDDERSSDAESDVSNDSHAGGAGVGNGVGNGVAHATAAGWAGAGLLERMGRAQGGSEAEDEEEGESGDEDESESDSDVAGLPLQPFF